MADGHIYDQHDILVAHRTLITPLNSPIRITNTETGVSIEKRVRDCGPYAKGKDGKYSREIDLSFGAAIILGSIKPGIIPVKIEPLM